MDIHNSTYCNALQHNATTTFDICVCVGGVNSLYSSCKIVQMRSPPNLHYWQQIAKHYKSLEVRHLTIFSWGGGVVFIQDYGNSQATQVVSMSTPSIIQRAPVGFAYPGMVLQCVAVSCSVLQCVAVCCSVLQCVAV